MDAQMRAIAWQYGALILINLVVLATVCLLARRYRTARRCPRNTTLSGRAFGGGMHPKHVLFPDGSALDQYPDGSIVCWRADGSCEEFSSMPPGSPSHGH